VHQTGMAFALVFKNIFFFDSSKQELEITLMPSKFVISLLSIAILYKLES
jgi:hypothetical protein